MPRSFAENLAMQQNNIVDALSRPAMPQEIKLLLRHLDFFTSNTDPIAARVDRQEAIHQFSDAICEAEIAWLGQAGQAEQNQYFEAIAEWCIKSLDSFDQHPYHYYLEHKQTWLGNAQVEALLECYQEWSESSGLINLLSQMQARQDAIDGYRTKLQADDSLEADRDAYVALANQIKETGQAIEKAAVPLAEGAVLFHLMHLGDCLSKQNADVDKLDEEYVIAGYNQEGWPEDYAEDFEKRLGRPLPEGISPPDVE